MTVAAESFARDGFAATTMEGIAAAAQTSIGSVYQFFPNKRAVFREVAMRCVELTRQSHPALVGPEPLRQPWNVVLDRYIDGYRRMFEDSVIMQAVWRNLELYGEYAEADEAMLREMVGVTAMLLVGWAPQLAPSRSQVVAVMIVNTIATTMLAIAREPDQGDALVEETKRMLRCYLTIYLGEPGEPEG